jgi:hypothetical protein
MPPKVQTAATATNAPPTPNATATTATQPGTVPPAAASPPGSSPSSLLSSFSSPLLSASTLDKENNKKLKDCFNNSNNINKLIFKLNQDPKLLKFINLLLDMVQ